MSFLVDDRGCQRCEREVTSLRRVVPGVETFLANADRSLVRISRTTSPVYEQALTGEQWAHIAVTGVSWLLIPLAIGLGVVMRAEVK